MKVLVDECVNFKLMRHLTGQAFVHVRDTSFRGMKNGALLRAVPPDYDVFLTLDGSIPYQQNLKRFPMAFIILRAVSNDTADLLPLIPALLATLEQIETGGYSPGDLYEVAAK
jgi:predicted nuclease of predicted toxin-antitoxin system